MVELGFHSTTECYVRGVQAIKVRGIENCEIHEIDMT